MDKGQKGNGCPGPMRGAATHGQFSGIRHDASLCTPT